MIGMTVESLTNSTVAIKICMTTRLLAQCGAARTKACVEAIEVDRSPRN